MSDNISRKAAIDSLKLFGAEHNAIAVIKGLPSTDRNGQWIFDGITWHCSECGKFPTKGMGYVQGEEELFDFCPNCGARMKGVDDESTL